MINVNLAIVACVTFTLLVVIGVVAALAITKEKRSEIFAYECCEGDKGIVVADSLEKAKEIVLKKYPERNIATNDDEYWNGGVYVFSVGSVQDNHLYDAFPW